MLWFSTEQASRAVLAGFAILVMALSLVLTMSRSGITGLAVALVLAGTVMARRQSGTSRRALTVGYLVFLVIAVVSWVGLDSHGRGHGPAGHRVPVSMGEFSLQMPRNAALFAVVAGLAIHDGRRL